MSDEEAERASEEEEEMEAEEAEPEHEEEEPEEHEHEAEDIPPPSGEKTLTETEQAIQAAKKKHEEEEAARLKEYEEQRKIQKQKEEEELAALKEKQERRRKEREEEEAMMAERMKAEEERRKHEEEERKKRMEADKAKKEAEKAKRQAMMALQGGAAPAGGSGPNFQVPKKDGVQDKFDKFGNIVKAKAEMGLTKEQLEEQKRKFLHDHLKPLSLEGMDIAAIRGQIKALHERVCKLEAETYDLEKRRERQEYDLKEMNERQRLINRNKALRKGLDPDAANSRYPPMIPVASKYDRQIDRRSYGDRKDIFEKPRKTPPPKLFHGSCRPPSDHGRHENEELELIRKNLEPFKYVEQAPVEGARPPMEIVAPHMDEGGGDEGEEEEEE